MIQNKVIDRIHMSLLRKRVSEIFFNFFKEICTRWWKRMVETSYARIYFDEPILVFNTLNQYFSSKINVFDDLNSILFFYIYHNTTSLLSLGNSSKTINWPKLIFIIILYFHRNCPHTCLVPSFPAETLIFCQHFIHRIRFFAKYNFLDPRISGINISFFMLFAISPDWKSFWISSSTYSVSVTECVSIDKPDLRDVIAFDWHSYVNFRFWCVRADFTNI